MTSRVGRTTTRRNRRIAVLCAIAVSVSITISVTAASDSTNPDATQSLISAEEAVHQAYLYTGFEEIKDASEEVVNSVTSLEVIEDDNTPFLRELIIGRSLWRVTMDIAWPPPEHPHTSTMTTLGSRRFVAWIDAETGRLLKILSEYDGDDPNMLPEPEADTAEFLMRSRKEIYHGIPDLPPQVRFRDALSNAKGSDPFRAKEILAVCVLHSHMGGAIKPVWSITGRGMTPFVFFSRRDSQPPEYMRNRRRTVVDATSGEALFWTNSPRITRSSPAVSDIDSSKHLITAEEAVHQAYLYTGFEEIKDADSLVVRDIAVLEVIEEDDTPYLSSRIIGKATWKVSTVITVFGRARHVDIWIDAQSGQFLRLFGRVPEYTLDMPPEPPAAIATTKLKSTGEVYLGFPDASPVITFLGALRGAFPSNPRRAKEMIAVCVIWSQSNEPAIPVWCITGRGIPNFKPRPGESSSPYDCSDRMRTVVDATTGRTIMATNSPMLIWDDAGQ